MTTPDVDEAAVRAWAREHGFRLVRTHTVANWLPVLRDLLAQDRIIYAVKLWAEVMRSGARPDLAAALAYITQVRNHTRPFPRGDEHPDLPLSRLDYYTGEPWRQ